MNGVQNATAAAAAAKLSTRERAAQAKLRAETWQKAWKREAWNRIRARITGDYSAHRPCWIDD